MATARLPSKLPGVLLISALFAFSAACADSKWASGGDDGSRDVIRTLYLATLPPDLPTVPFVDPARYAGTWFEIASIPQGFSVGCQCTTATYGVIASDLISVDNQCNLNSPTGPANTISGRAFVTPGTGNAKLEVEFFPIFRGAYWIIGLADDYSWALVGDPYRGSLFVLSRARTLDAGTYGNITALATNLGFNVAALSLTPQTGCL